MSAWYPDVDDGSKYPSLYLVSDYIVRGAECSDAFCFEIIVRGPTLKYCTGSTEEHETAISDSYKR